jgi:hypothetical protein
MDLDSFSFDLPSVVTHEAGHFLGIAHTQLSDRTITMYPSIDTGEIRVLSPDDIAAICAIYPPGTLDPSCDPEPRHGFSTECTFADSSCNCAIGFGRWGKQSGKFGALLTTIIGMMALIRRRKIPGS